MREELTKNDLDQLFAEHPRLPSEDIRDCLLHTIAMHQEREQDQVPPLVEVSSCFLIALLYEVLSHRYHRQELPFQKPRETIQ